MKSYCDRCKRIDEVVGTLWNLHLTGVNLTNTKTEWTGVIGDERKRALRRLLLSGEAALCDDCLFLMLDMSTRAEV